MIIVAICVFILFLAIVLWMKKIIDGEVLGFFSAVSIIVAAVYCFLSSVIPSQRESGIVSIEIVQLKEQTHNSISGGGSFIGWAINGSTEMKYVVMQKFSDGRMKRVFLDQDDTCIVETDETPHVEFPNYTSYYSKLWSIAWLWYEPKDFYREYKATIYIPTGTFISKFEME